MKNLIKQIVEKITCLIKGHILDLNTPGLWKSYCSRCKMCTREGGFRNTDHWQK